MSRMVAVLLVALFGLSWAASPAQAHVCAWSGTYTVGDAITFDCEGATLAFIHAADALGEQGGAIELCNGGSASADCVQGCQSVGMVRSVMMIITVRIMPVAVDSDLTVCTSSIGTLTVFQD